jgi:hypothetical protein
MLARKVLLARLASSASRALAQQNALRLRQAFRLRPRHDLRSRGQGARFLESRDEVLAQPLEQLEIMLGEACSCSFSRSDSRHLGIDADARPAWPLQRQRPNSTRPDIDTAIRKMSADTSSASAVAPAPAS